MPLAPNLAAGWLTGWVGAACEQEAELAARDRGEAERRLPQARAGELAVTVDHAEALAGGAVTGLGRVVEAGASARRGDGGPGRPSSGGSARARSRDGGSAAQGRALAAAAGTGIVAHGLLRVGDGRGRGGWGACGCRDAVAASFARSPSTSRSRAGLSAMSTAA